MVSRQIFVKLMDSDDEYVQPMTPKVAYVSRNAVIPIAQAVSRPFVRGMISAVMDIVVHATHLRETR